MWKLIFLSAVVSVGLSAVFGGVAEVRVASERDVSTLRALGIEHDRPRADGTVSAYPRTPADIEKLAKSGLSFRVVKDTSRDNYVTWRDATRRRSLNSRASLDFTYHDSIELETYMKSVVAQYDFTAMYNIGTTIKGRPMYVMQVSRNPGVEEAEPKVILLANMHGDEVVGREMLIHFIDYLTTMYSTDTTVQSLVNGLDIYIMPAANPDGFELGIRGNAHGVDLNRDFPDRFKDTDDNFDGRAVETIAIMNFTMQKVFTLGANLHGGSVVANYPYDTNAQGRNVYTASPDDALYIQLAKTYADAHLTMHDSKQFAGGITNGADWYCISGSIQDWSYVFQEIFDITLELSMVKWPNESELPSFWDENLPALIAYTQVPLRAGGVRGVVRSSSGSVLSADVHVSTATTVVQSDPQTGFYQRLLPAGTHQVWASAPGHVDSDHITITVPAAQTEPIKLDLYTK